MSERGSEAASTHDLPTFSECVVGYRRWHADDQNRLWPLWAARRPWTPGANTARCNCRSSASLRFEWNEFDGRRTLEPAPEHDAPDQHCDCGLYSWRLPPRSWRTDASCSTPPNVIGAVASWGRMQVHADGFRAERACVVLLAHHPSVSDEALSRLGDVAELYRVEVVGVEELEQRSQEFGSPLPASVMPAPKPLVEPTPRRPRAVPPSAPRREDRQVEETKPRWLLPVYLGGGLTIIIGLVIAGFWLLQHGTAPQSVPARAHATTRTHNAHLPAGITVFLFALALLVLGGARLLEPVTFWVQDLRLQRHIRRHGLHEAS